MPTCNCPTRSAYCWLKLKLELEQLTARIDQMDSVIQHTVKENRSLPAAHDHPGGVGQWAGRAALVAAIGSRERISERARPGGVGGDGSPRVLHRRQTEVMGISKRGNNWLRRLFVQRHAL